MYIKQIYLLNNFNHFQFYHIFCLIEVKVKNKNNPPTPTLVTPMNIRQSFGQLVDNKNLELFIQHTHTFIQG